MTIIETGSKLYSYVLGPMTVLSSDDKHVLVYVDDPEGISKELDSISRNGRTKTFAINCINHWIFTNPDDVSKNENNDFSSVQGQTPQALIYNPRLLHSYYKNEGMKSKATKTAESPVKVRGSGDEESAVKISENESYSGESPVKIRTKV